MRWAGIIAILQSLVGIGYAILLIVRNVIGYEDPSVVTTQANMQWVGIGTAVFFIIVFGAVVAGALTMMTGRRWGRGPVVFLQMILLPIAFTMWQGGAVLFAVVTAVSAVGGLVLVFNRASTDWASRRYARPTS